jgi:hypothetical protein
LIDVHARKERLEQERVPGPGRSPARLFCFSISLKGTLRYDFSNIHKPRGVVTTGVQVATGIHFPPPSQSVALAAPMSLSRKELPPRSKRIRRWQKCCEQSQAMKQR